MRIFLLGDSFTANLFENEFKKIANDRVMPFDYDSDIFNYVNLFYEKRKHAPFHFSDWLKEWGYDVRNFGEGGASLDEIIHQFGKIPLEYKEGDRIILNLTHHSRFMWFMEHNQYIRVVPGYDHPGRDEKLMEFLQEQCIQRTDNVDNKGYLKKVYFKFINYLIQKHSNYNPIVWGPFVDINAHFEKNSYFFNHRTIFNDSCHSIYTETQGQIDDRHLGITANHALATAFDILIKENSISDYNNEDLENKIRSKINKTKLINPWIPLF